MADTILGLVMEINADPSKASEALDAFEKATGKSFERAAAGTKPLDTALLSNRESVRLVTEELGVHMPRAVTGALAEMVPAIGAFGGVLLGAFAIEEIPKLVAGIEEAVQSWEGFGKAEREAMDRAIKDTASLHTKVLDVEKELELFGKNEAEQAALRAKWAGEDSDRALKSLLTAEGKSNAIRAQIAGVKQDLNSYTVTLGNIYENQLKAQEAQVAKLREAWKLADEQALLAQKRAAEASAELTQKTAEPQAKAAQWLAEYVAHMQREIEGWQKEAPKALRELTAGAKAYDAALERSRNNQTAFNLFLEKMARDEIALLPLQQLSLQTIRQTVPQIYEEATATKHLSAATREYVKAKQDAVHVSQAFMQATKAEVAAIQDDMLGGLKQLAEGAGALIKNQKAAAVFKAGYEIAEGIAALASGTWPPNPAAIIAAGLHFEAAAQYAMMGGSGGGGSRHGGPGGSQSSYGGSPGSGGSGPGGSSGGGSGGHGPTIVLNQYGPMVGTMNDLAKAMVNTINQLGKSGQVRLTAYNSLTNGAKQT